MRIAVDKLPVTRWQSGPPTPRVSRPVVFLDSAFRTLVVDFPTTNTRARPDRVRSNSKSWYKTTNLRVYVPINLSLSRRYRTHLGDFRMPLVKNLQRLIHLIAFLACLTSNAIAQQAEPNNQERVSSRLLALAEANPRLELKRIEHDTSQSVFVQGYFSVPENRDSKEGRSIQIGLIVLPARSEDPSPDPVFFLHGGPGAAATKLFRRQVNGWIRKRRDVVLIDQRGTGSSNRLQVQMPGGNDDLQGYFESWFQPKI